MVRDSFWGFVSKLRVRLNNHMGLTITHTLTNVMSPSSLSSRCAFYNTEFGQGGCPDTLHGVIVFESLVPFLVLS